MKRFLVFVFAAFLFSSCNFLSKRVGGDGNVTVQNRSVQDFTGVDVGGAIDLYITQDAGFSVKVEIDQNLQEYIEVYNDGNQLHVRQRNNTSLNPTGDIKVYVTAPQFHRIGASGACQIKGQNKLTSPDRMEVELSGASGAELDLKAPSVKVDMSGACAAKLTGETKDLDVDGSGSTHVKAMDLMTENASIDVSGASEAEVFASVKLNVEASGASSVRYKGNATVSARTSGASNISKAD